MTATLTEPPAPSTDWDDRLVCEESESDVEAWLDSQRDGATRDEGSSHVG